MSKNNMITGAPGKSLFFFALPMIIGNLFQQFYNMVDSIIVGKFVGEEALAAVGASYALTTVFISIAIGGGMGASVLTSQYLGAKQYAKMKTSVGTALITFLVVSIILGMGGVAGSKGIMIWLNTPENILDQAVLYLKIYFGGLPFLFMYNILASIFNSLGRSRIPLYLLLFSSLLNIVLDLGAVCVLKMGVAGVAAATVAAQGISAVCSFAILLRTLKKYEEESWRRFDKAQLGRMTRIALPSILQQSIVSIGMMLVQSVVNGFGSSVLAGYSAGMRIESICIVPMSAMGNAVSTFAAQNIGANQKERAQRGYFISYGIITAFAVVICLVLEIFHEGIMALFLEEGANELAFQTGKEYLTFIGFFFGIIGLKMITDGILRGAGDMVWFTVANLVNLGIRVAFSYIFAPVIGVAAVWYAVPIGWAANYIISFIRFLTGKWKKVQLQ